MGPWAIKEIKKDFKCPSRQPHSQSRLHRLGRIIFYFLNAVT